MNNTLIRPTPHLEMALVPAEGPMKRPCINEHEAPPIARDLHLSFDNDRILLENMLKPISHGRPHDCLQLACLVLKRDEEHAVRGSWALSENANATHGNHGRFTFGGGEFTERPARFNRADFKLVEVPADQAHRVGASRVVCLIVPREAFGQFEIGQLGKVSNVDCR